MKKKLGQHFLNNQKAIRAIIAALDLKPNDVIIEIGPGRGALTQELRITNPELRIIGIEKDSRLVDSLKKRFATGKKTEIIHGDALKIIPVLTANPSLLTSYKLVGNIPYYITGRLFRILSELNNKPELSVFTIQKEVAFRLTAKPPKMNLLAASVQIWANVGIIMSLKPRDFTPEPKVSSSVIKIIPKTDLPREDELNRYYKFIKTAFSQPRKTLANNLKGLSNKSKFDFTGFFEKCGLTGLARPQDLDVKKINCLVKNLLF